MITSIDLITGGAKCEAHVEVQVGRLIAVPWERVDVEVEQTERSEIGQTGLLLDLSPSSSLQTRVAGFHMASWLEPFSDLGVINQRYRRACRVDHKSTGSDVSGFIVMATQRVGRAKQGRHSISRLDFALVARGEDRELGADGCMTTGHSRNRNPGYGEHMRRITLVAALALIAAGCGNVLENIEITIDGEQIFVDTCQDLADSIAETVDQKLDDVDANQEADLPDIDVEGLIDQADDLGCSPEELRRLVNENLAGIESATEKARGFLDGLRDEFGSDSG